jgi:virulence factor Mce-like protein
MRRRVGIVAVAGVAALAVWFALGASHGDRPPRYWVELDNAFGLIEGADLKVAGVRAGTIKRLALDHRTHRALVQVEITRAGFGSLRADVRCATRPQSLIGEYFLDCDPGTSRRVLREGARIPVTRTASTVAPDLVSDIMRRPYRERLSIILGELGAGVAARGPDLNAAIRRASPALRETDRVLAMLARQKATLADLVTNADRVVGDLAANHRDVGRWVVEARDTARTSAQRRSALAAGFHKLPAFLEQLRPTMASLQEVARAQTPALRNLDASAQQLQTLFTRLRPFADASGPAFDVLGKASATGDRAVRSAGPVVDALASFSGGTPELGRNLATVLEHLDDRRWAVEKDPRSPGGQGYTGLEALLTYVYDQTLSTNAFDSNVHYLKVAIDSGDCAHYADTGRARDLEDKCAARIGPHALGIAFDDPTKDGDNDQPASRKSTDGGGGPAAPTLPSGGGGGGGEPPVGGAEPPVGGTTTVPPSSSTPTPPSLPPVVPSAPAVPPLQVPDPPAPPASSKDAGSQKLLLDYLMGP